MKFLHTGDLHIGKTVNEFSMIEEQRFFLNQIMETARREKAEAVLLAGDIYDRSIPSTEAVSLLNAFLSALCREGIPVLMIAGNHDSPERIGFANQILEKQGIYIAGSFEGTLRRVVLEDEYGKVNFVLMPFTKPATVGAGNQQEAVEFMLKGIVPDPESGRNVLVTHYFVTAGGQVPELSDSESSIRVGGLDNVEAASFADFDYVALGHIHKPQKIGEREVHYAGSPMKYSFSETEQTKGVLLVELLEKGKVEVRRCPFHPLHDMRKIKGRLKDLIQKEIVSLSDNEDYLQVTLTDDEELYDAIGSLRAVYPNVMQIMLSKNEDCGADINVEEMQSKKSILALYEDFYQIIKGHEIEERQRNAVIRAVKEAEGGE